MLRLSVQKSAQEKRRTTVVIILVLLETLLVTLVLIPPQLWTHLLPNSPGAAQNGPFPQSVALLIPPLLYILPTLVGFLCKNWQHALFYATLPAWIGLGLFVTAANLKVGIFYLVAPDSVTGNVSILELFAALGGIGWLAQCVLQARRTSR